MQRPTGILGQVQPLIQVLCCSLAEDRTCDLSVSGRQFYHNDTELLRWFCQVICFCSQLFAAEPALAWVYRVLIMRQALVHLPRGSEHGMHWLEGGAG